MQNPSGTAAAADNSKMLSLWNQGRSIMQSIQYDLLSNPALGKDIFNKIGQFFGKPAIKAGMQFGAEQIPQNSSVFLPGQTQPSFDQPLFMPKRMP